MISAMSTKSSTRIFFTNLVGSNAAGEKGLYPMLALVSVAGGGGGGSLLSRAVIASISRSELIEVSAFNSGRLLSVCTPKTKMCALTKT